MLLEFGDLFEVPDAIGEENVAEEVVTKEEKELANLERDDDDSDLEGLVGYGPEELGDIVDYITALDQKDLTFRLINGVRYGGVDAYKKVMRLYMASFTAGFLLGKFARTLKGVCAAALWQASVDNPKLVANNLRLFMKYLDPAYKYDTFALPFPSDGWASNARARDYIWNQFLLAAQNKDSPEGSLLTSSSSVYLVFIVIQPLGVLKLGSRSFGLSVAALVNQVEEGPFNNALFEAFEKEEALLSSSEMGLSLTLYSKKLLQLKKLKRRIQDQLPVLLTFPFRE